MRAEKLSFWQCVNEDERYPNFAIEVEYEEEIIPAGEARIRSTNNMLKSDSYKSFKKTVIKEIEKGINNGETDCLVVYNEYKISVIIRYYMESLLKEQGYVVKDDCCGKYKIYW